MRSYLGATALVACILIAAQGDQAAAKKELAKLQGTWAMVTGEKEGKKLAEEHIQKSKIVYNEASVEVTTPHQSGDVIKATFKIDPTKNPKEIDWVRANGPDAGKTMKGIYEWMGDDQYRVCFSPAGKDRPTEFKTKEGSGQMMHVWKRVKR